MSSTTTVLSSQPHIFRFSPALSSRSQFRIRQPSYQAQQPQRTAEPGQPSFDTSRSNMSSTAYYGQRPVSYETGASRDSYVHAAAPVQRSWATGRDGQTWQEDYHQTTSSQNHQQQQQRQYQSSQQIQVAPQARLSVSGAASHVSRHSTRPSTPNSGYSSHTASATSTSGDASMVKHSLQIPARISPKGGNLADFSAQVGLVQSFLKEVLD